MKKINELFSEESVQFPSDVATLKQCIPQLRGLSNSTVEELYSDFSDGWAAGWLILDDETIENFRHWLDT